MLRIKRFLTGRTVVLALLILIALAGILSGYYFYTKYQLLVKNPDVITQQEVDWLVDKVGKIIVLPEDESPSIATVLDKEKLKKQAFFKNAENGDKIMVYKNNRKAILYRPSANKLIEVMPIVIDTEKNSATSQTIKVAIYNGSETDLLDQTESQIREKISNIEVVKKKQASKQDYQQTIVVDLTGKQTGQANAIAASINGKVGDLPADEKKPDADILIIVAE